MDKMIENDDSDGEGVQVNITRLGKFVVSFASSQPRYVLVTEHF